MDFDYLDIDTQKRMVVIHGIEQTVCTMHNLLGVINGVFKSLAIDTKNIPISFIDDAVILYLADIDGWEKINYGLLLKSIFGYRKD